MARQLARNAIQSQGMFPCEAEIARRLSQDPREWGPKALILERDGFPRIDPLMGRASGRASRPIGSSGMGSLPSRLLNLTERRTSMPSDFLFPKLDAPRLKARPSKANPERLYWVARTDIVKTGYRPETVRIHHDIRDPDAHRLIEAMCKRLQAECSLGKLASAASASCVMGPSPGSSVHIRSTGRVPITS